MSEYMFPNEEQKKKMEEAKLTHPIYVTMPLTNEALQIHSRALAAYCECMAMQAENQRCFALHLRNGQPTFELEKFTQVMQKWSLIDEKGEPLI